MPLWEAWKAERVQGCWRVVGGRREPEWARWGSELAVTALSAAMPAAGSPTRVTRCARTAVARAASLLSYGGQRPSSALRNPRGAPRHSLQTAQRDAPPGDRCRDRNL